MTARLAQFAALTIRENVRDFRDIYREIFVAIPLGSGTGIHVRRAKKDSDSPPCQRVDSALARGIIPSPIYSRSSQSDTPGGGAMASRSSKAAETACNSGKVGYLIGGAGENPARRGSVTSTPLATYELPVDAGLTLPGVRTSVPIPACAPLRFRLPKM